MPSTEWQRLVRNPLQRREYVVVVDYNGTEKARDRRCVGRREREKAGSPRGAGGGEISELVASGLSQNGAPPPPK